MKVAYLPIVLGIIITVLISGCTSQLYSEIGKNKNNQKECSIDCSSINSKPELWYIKSEQTIGYYSYIPTGKLNHATLNVAYEAKERIEELLNKNESIQRSGLRCGFEVGIEKNENYVYCKHHSFRFKDVSEDGEIHSLGWIRIDTTFSVNRTKNRLDTNGGYIPVEDSELVLHECSISFSPSSEGDCLSF